MYFLETIAANMVGSGQKAHQFFLALASGRIKIPGIEYKTAPSSSSTLPSSSSDSSSIVVAPTSTDNSTDLPLPPPYVTTDLIVADTDAGALKLIEVEEHWEAVAARAVAMLAMILKPQYAPGFLLQVVSGRFHSV
jgi:hypothetical protein